MEASQFHNSVGLDTWHISPSVEELGCILNQQEDGVTRTENPKSTFPVEEPSSVLCA